MGKHRKISKIVFITSMLTLICNFLIFSNQTRASNYDNEEINNDIAIVKSSMDDTSARASTRDGLQIAGMQYYIKNMQTGQYLDVAGGVAADGTTVRQYKFNGTDSQKWRIHYWGSGVYGILSALGRDGTTYKYALAIEEGANYTGARLQLGSWNTSNAQQFSIVETNYNTYGFMTKTSNYEYIVTLGGEVYHQEANVVQSNLRNYAYDYWILEPVIKNEDFGVKYAKTNYDKYVQAYPNLTEFQKDTADCANFASQCLLAGGHHYDGNWKIYRKNGFSYKPKTIEELNDTWELCQPNASPWVSAKEFGDYWRKKVKTEYYTVNYILNNPETIMNKAFFEGDIIQVAKNNLGFLAESTHTMYITGYNKYNGQESYALTYHSNSQIDRNLLEACQAYKDKGENPYIVFFSM